MKRSKLITVIAIFFLLSVPFDLFAVLTISESTYRANINSYESLIKDGMVMYRGRTVYWNKQSEAAKQRTIHELALQKNSF